MAGWILKISSILCVLPGVFFAFLLASMPVNDYRAMGIESAYDCDGPGVMVLLIIFSGFFLIISAILLLLASRFSDRKKFYWIVIPLILFCLFCITITIPDILSEHQRNQEPDSPCVSILKNIMVFSPHPLPLSFVECESMISARLIS